MKSSRTARRPSLNVQSLEGREVPAGMLTASLTAGVLSVTGTDQAEVVTVKVTGTDVVLTPNASTVINGQMAGTAVTLPGAATSMKVDLKGGDDTFKIDAMSDFVLAKGANINLGHGDNTLSLATTQKVDLGSLAVKGGDGKETVSVFGSAGKGSIVRGAATFEYGAGESDTTLAETTYAGPAGVSVKGSKSGGASSVNASNLIVPKTLAVFLPTDTAAVTLTNGTFGGLSAGGPLAATVDLAGTKVTGNVAVTSPYVAQLTATSAAVGGNVTMAGKIAFSEWAGVTTVGGNVRQTGAGALMSVGAAAADALAVTGNVTLAAGTAAGSQLDHKFGKFSAGNVALSGFTAEVQSTAGDFAVKNLAVAASFNGGAEFTGGKFAAAGNVSVTSKSGAATFTATGAAAAVDGNLTVAAPLVTYTTVDTAGKAEVKGNMAVTGGSAFDTVKLGATFHAHKNVTLKLKDGDNIIDVGDTAAQAVINGNLAVTTGAGSDTLNFVQSVVNGTTAVITGAGADTFDADYGAQFKKAFTLDLGAGDDTFDVARTKGSMGDTIFTGKTVVKGGDGNDAMFLGSGLFGDAHTKASFSTGLGSVIDGGAGYNVFDQGLFSNFDGLKYGTTITNFTDPSQF